MRDSALAHPSGSAARHPPPAFRSLAPIAVRSPAATRIPVSGVTTSRTPPTAVAIAGRAAAAASIRDTGVPSLSELSSAASAPTAVPGSDRAGSQGTRPPRRSRARAPSLRVRAATRRRRRPQAAASAPRAAPGDRRSVRSSRLIGTTRPTKVNSISSVGDLRARAAQRRRVSGRARRKGLRSSPSGMTRNFSAARRRASTNSSTVAWLTPIRESLTRAPTRSSWRYRPVFAGAEVATQHMAVVGVDDHRTGSHGGAASRPTKPAFAVWVWTM